MPYVPKTENTPRILARGKLWSRYINAKRSLNKSKKNNIPSIVWSNRQFLVKLVKINYILDNIQKIDDNKEEETTNNEYMNYLFTCTGPDDTIYTYWEKTRNIREKIIKELDTNNILKKFRH